MIVGVSRVPITACTCGRTKPSAIIARIASRNTNVGPISSLADSVIPNMLTAVRIASPTSDTSSMWLARPGNTLARLAAPAARLTATVST